jgi:hypothetical protein
MTLASTPEGEKAWPTSVLLLDKQRPYQKRCALRYMIVGMKQNHTLQLWDLALGKPVQEFNLPHSKESDAVCSVMYHPATGMIVIGHPTRNSIYFAHLSAPKYNLKSVSQAEYIQRLVTQDSSIPQPDSTAVISGVREYSFASRGVLRSLDILSNPAMIQEADEPTLFELYAMHSKGVACLLIRQSELGWSKENKVVNAVDAVTEGIVQVSRLKTPQQEPAVSGEPATRLVSRPKDSIQTAATQAEPAPRAAETATPAKAKIEPKDNETPVQSSKEGPPEKPERKSRKKKNAKEPEVNANGSSPRVQLPKSDAPKTSAHVTNGIPSDSLDSAMANVESRLAASLAETIETSIKSLQGSIDENARVRDDTFNKHQLKLLDNVSEVLNDNTQKVLQALIHKQFSEMVVPAIGDKVGRAVTDLLHSKLQPNVASAVQREIQNALPHALNRSLRSGDVMNAISDRVIGSVSSDIQQEMGAMSQRLTQSLSGMVNQTAQRVASEVHQQYHEQMEHMNAQRAADSAKLDQLHSYVTRLTDMVSTMAASQSSLQAEFLKFKQQPVHELPGVSGVAGPQVHLGPASLAGTGYGSGSAILPGNAAPSHHGSFTTHSQAPSQPQQFMGSPQFVRAAQAMASPHGSAPGSELLGPPNVSMQGYTGSMAKAEPEVDADLIQRIRTIELHIQEGRLQDAIIQWIQSGRESEIFRLCLTRYPPSKFEELGPLMLLVVIATLSKDLKANQSLKEEIDWIEMAVRAFGESINTHDWEKQGSQEVIRSTSQTMELLISHIRPLIASLSDVYPTDPFIANLDKNKLLWIVNHSEHILNTFRY